MRSFILLFYASPLAAGTPGAWAAVFSPGGMVPIREQRISNNSKKHLHHLFTRLHCLFHFLLILPQQDLSNCRLQFEVWGFRTEMVDLHFSQLSIDCIDHSFSVALGPVVLGTRFARLNGDKEETMHALVANVDLWIACDACMRTFELLLLMLTTKAHLANTALLLFLPFVPITLYFNTPH